MLKLCRRYLHWIQNSVLEGEITDVKLKSLIAEANGIMKDGDSLIIFKSRNNKWLEKEVYGSEKNTTDNFI
jgi:CRISPR-associated protein Cas2